MMSKDIDCCAILLRNIESLDEKDLQEFYLPMSKNEKVVEAMFIPDGRDRAVVVFTNEKFAKQAVQIDHGDIEVSLPSTSVFTSVTATIDKKVQEMVKSPTTWQFVVEGLKRWYGVHIDGLEISGSWLPVEMCMLTLQKMSSEYVNPTDTAGGTPEMGTEERGSGTTTDGVSEESDKESLYIFHGNRHGAAGRDSCNTGEHQATSVSKKTYQIMSTKVHVYVGDITKLKVDVIVNAANKHLQHGGGVAAAIARAAGPSLYRECNSYIETHGYIECGSGVMTSSGQLPCRSVFHVVGPMWSDYVDKNECLDILECALTNCLTAAEESECCSSIAIPAVSSGLYGVPRDLVAKVMHEAVRRFCESHKSLRDIHLVDINSTMVTLLQQYFDNQQEASSQTPATTNGMRCEAESITCGHLMLSGATTTESVTDNDPGEPHSTDSSAIRTGVQQKTDNKELINSVRVLPTHEQPHPPNASVGTSHRQREKDNTTPAAGDKTSKSYAAVATGGATHLKQGTDKVATKASGTAAAKDDHSEEVLCPVCRDQITDPKVLSICKHKFCKACIDNCFIHKKECPVCRLVYGKLQGNQPKNGIMTVTKSYDSLPGYNCPTIVIRYMFPNGTQTQKHPNPGKTYNGTNRTAYLPDNVPGQRVLKLLQEAFDQQLTFTVGQSVTTGRDNCVTWNDIHHKTNCHGGPDNYGYPDAGYLQRVTEDLAAKGIK